MIELPDPKPWHADAACARSDIYDPDWWHPSGFVTAGWERKQAVWVCRHECPVVDICLAENIHEREGVWGGTTEAQRDTMRRKRRARRGHLKAAP